MDFIRRSLALGCAFGIAGCAQSGLGGSQSLAGGLSALPSLQHTGSPPGRVHRKNSTDPEIYVFQALPDAETPSTGLVNIGNTLYGTTTSGGAERGAPSRS